MWRDSTVCILASGPSMNERVAEQVMAKGFQTIVTNDTWKLAPDAHALFAADWSWWVKHPEAVAFRGFKFCSEDSQIPGVRYVAPQGSKVGGNSALWAARFARDQGAGRILLFGVDLRDDELTHWHGQHDDGLGNPNVAAFRRARAAWAVFAAEPRPEVINCNPRSGLECFPKMMIDEVSRQTALTCF